MRREAMTIIFLGCFIFAFFASASYPLPLKFNDQLVLFRTSQTDSPIIIDGDTELAQQSTGGDGTVSDPYVITGLTISLDLGPCISVLGTTAFFVIRDCTFQCQSDDWPVILFHNVENGMLESSYLRGGSSGVEFSDCSNCVVKQTTCITAMSGIQLTYSNNCTILDCFTHSNEIGIVIDNSHNSLILNNSIYGNSIKGVNIGFFSENTTIYRNEIGWNTINAFNDGNYTEFTDGLGSGNAWGDYDGSGLYLILGSTSVLDTNPLALRDITNPRIRPLDDIVYDVESIGVFLAWTANDDFFYSYRIDINDELYIVDVWDGRQIIFSLDFLSEGSYTIKLYVYDVAGNMASDEVAVTAVSFMFGGIGTEQVVWGSLLTLVLFIGVIAVIKKMP